MRPTLRLRSKRPRSLLEERLGSRSAAIAEQCWSLTAGWAAALALIVDRLERIDPDRWGQTLAELGLRRGSQWREFATDVVRREQGSSQRILAIASVAPAVDADLIAGLGVVAPEAELESLQRRGLLVTSGEHGGRTLSPVLAAAVAEQLPAAEAEALRAQAAQWLEESGRLGEVLECAVGGPCPDALSLLERCGPQLVVGGHALRVAEVLRELGTEGDAQLDALLAEALVAVGDWDGAMEIYGAIRRNAGGGPLAAGDRLALRRLAVPALGDRRG